MLSIRCNSHLRSWRNHKRLAKNKENLTLINKYVLEGINSLSEKDDWKIFEKNNLTVAFNAF